MNKILKNKKTGRDVTVLELPKNNTDMEEFVLKNKQTIYKSIVTNIETAINKRWGAVEVFSFEESNFVVVINRKDFKENLQNVFDSSLEDEHFEICAKAKKVIDKLDKISFVANYKINHKKYNVKKETPVKKATKQRNNRKRKKGTKG
jgi:hypothetical protein